MVEKREVWWPNGKASVSGPGITEDCGLYSFIRHKTSLCDSAL
ncbi:uncharacterized protein RCO7_14194 [Rhynchosporium graminicola]|uniref:Uncharacterized protein n=1 Tax=Rhynchosporium graminicola TaxID=2792576 RepID=A0A1E1JYW5_9HELO|nr:uncharacterized protein RCO7_14194 [Rhynchosporium commune]